MRGSIKRRYEGSWSLILDLGYQTDPQTGLRRRKQKWLTFRGTKKQAESKLNDVLAAHGRDEFVEPSKMTVAEWLTEWVEKAIKPPKKRASTYAAYRRVIRKNLEPAIGSIRLQQLKALDLEQVLRRSETVVRDVNATPRDRVRGAQSGRQGGDRDAQCRHARDRQTHADEGSRQDAVLGAGRGTGLPGCSQDGRSPVRRTLRVCPRHGRSEKRVVRAQVERSRFGEGDSHRSSGNSSRRGRTPEFGPVKNGIPRTVDLGAETIELLRSHKREQAAIKMANRTTYQDHGLVFAKEWGHLFNRKESLGLPLQSNNMGQREFAKIIKAAKVRTITIHGLRHTCATLLLKAGVPVHVVSQRLGHKKIQITLDIYAHVLPSMQRDAAQRLGAMLHG